MEVCLGDKVHLLKETRQLVVKTRNKLVHRFKLATMVQGGDEPITSFKTRMKPVARTGKFQVECVACKGQADYTDQMVLDNLQSQEDQPGQAGVKHQITKTLCRTWELPQHMPRWYLDMGGGGHHW